MTYGSTPITPGAGANIANDDVAGVKLQIIKLDVGAEGARAPLVGGVATPNSSDVGMPVRAIGADVVSASFTDSGSSLLSPNMTQRKLGTGVTVSQASSNLVVTAGTTTNAEFLARSVKSWRGSLFARVQSILSQRVANNNFMVLLADLVGEGLSYTNTTTAVTVTFPVTNPFTAVNVGQSVMLGALTPSSGAGVPGRYALASVSGLNAVFTVAGWTAGAGTLDVFGWNHTKLLYNGTTATAAAFDSQRNGWGSGDTTLALNTSASPGHIAQIHMDGRDVKIHDTLAASTTTPNAVLRGIRLANIPDEDRDLYLYIWSYNGTTAPTATTWTVGFWSVERFANNPVSIASVRMQGTSPPLPVSQVGTATVAVTGAVSTTGTTTNTPVTPTTPFLTSAATTNATLVKSSAGTLFSILITSTSASVRYLKLYNKASAPTVGTDVPVITVTIPAGGTLTLDGGTLGVRFGTGIGLAITGAAADNDTTAIAAGEIKLATNYL